MKKFCLIFILFFAIFCSVFLSGCESASNQEKAAAGRYDLTRIEYVGDGDGMTAEDFEYNYIVLKSDKRFELYNKYKEAEYKTKGKWSLNGTKLTFKLSGLFAQKEHHILEDETITLKGNLEGKSTKMYYTKSN